MYIVCVCVCMFSQRQSLQPSDELFLFLMYLSVGLMEQDLANRFNIHTTTVSRIISSWTNYLYTLLGSVSIWIDAKHVKACLPDDFKDFSDTQVIVNCTELKCLSSKVRCSLLTSLTAQ